MKLVSDQETVTTLTHDHVFGQDQPVSGERRTWWVITLTAVTMVIEILAGWAFGSMALLADGLHMASHAVALVITALAYLVARRQAGNPRLSFGSGKVGSLAGFTSAVLLVLFAVMMAAESVARFIHPVQISFNEAIAVAVLGLVVNGISVLLLRDHHDHTHHEQSTEHGGHGHGHDHNLRAAHLHVLADALTSLLAIFALLAAKQLGAVWIDPLMGIVGGALIARWSWSLIRESGAVLLDRQAPESALEEIRSALTAGGRLQVVDLHVWAIGPGYRAAIIAVQCQQPCSPSDIKRLLPTDLKLAHVTVEIHSPDCKVAQPPRSSYARAALGEP
jgi:cation diffusion facilitator family transporter